MKTITILLIEDNSSDARLIKEILKEINHFKSNIIAVETLRHGCDQIQKINFDIILLDLNLPDSTGENTFQKVVDCCEDIPIVLITGNEDEELSLKLIMSGAQDYFTKQSLNSSLLGKSILYSIERKKTEISLLESETKYRTMVMQSPDGIFIVDLAGTFLSVNRSMCDILKYTEEEFLSMKILDIVAEQNQPHHKLRLAAMLNGDNTNDIAEYDVRGKDGVEHSVEVRSVLFYRGKELIGFQGVARDFTERRRAEKALKESEEKYRVFFENSIDAILLTTPEGKTLSANPAACSMFGYSEDELIKIGRSGVEDKTNQELSELLSERTMKKKVQGELSFMRKDRTRFPAEISSSIFTNHEGFELTSMIIRDITVRKDSEKEIAMLAYSLKSVNECVSITDLDDNILFVNESFLRTYGYGINELIGKSIRVVRSQSNEKEYVNKILSHTISGAWQGELLNRKKDGSEFPIYLSTSIIKDKNSKLLGLVGVATDITERKRAEETLLKLSSAIEQTVDTLVITDRNGTIEYVNHAFEDTTGYSSGEALGKTPRILKSGTKDPQYYEELWKTILSGKVFRSEILNKKKNGDLYYVEKTISPIFDKNNNITHFVGTGIDITERKLAEETLMKLSSAIEQTVDLIIITDRNGTIEYVNKAFERLTGYSAEEVIGKTPRILKSGSKDQKYYEALWKTILSGKVFRSEILNKKKNGDLYYEEKSISPILDKNNNITHFVSTGLDITERKHAEKELIDAKEKAEENDKLKTAFLQNMSHEIRTPMNAIVGFSELMELELGEPEKLKYYIKIIRQRSDDLLGIINDLLDIARIESGQLGITYNHVDLNKLFEELHSLFIDHKLQIEKSSIKFIVKEMPTSFNSIVSTDLGKLKQIFSNLIHNAFKFTREGKIEFGFHSVNNNRITFFVADSGTGISKDMKDLIFERFRKSADESVYAQDGMGLGLAIVKGLLKLFDGRIRVESEPNEGSTFFFSIPYIPISVKNETETLDNNQKYDWSDFTLLIVEDDKFNIAYFTEILGSTGISLLIGETGNQAISLFINNRNIDLVLMDIKLPDSNGYELTKEFKKLHPEIPIIAQTAYAAVEDGQKALDVGCIDFITKPIHRNLFLEILCKYLIPKPNK